MDKQSKYFSIIIFSIISLCFISCETEQYNPVGVWEDIKDSENKIILQKKDDIDIASRQKGSFIWYVFNKENANLYIGEESNNLEFLSSDTLEIFSKKMRQFKKVYKRTDSKIEGFWLLNLLMPRETVEEVVGKPDSISKKYTMEEWFYGENKVIRFNKKGVHSFSENNILNPDLHSIALGDHYKDVIKKLGSPYHLERIVVPDSINLHYFYYNGEKAKITLQDSMVYLITIDVPRSNKELSKLIESSSHFLSFNTNSTDNSGITVEEKGKVVDRLTVSFEHDHQVGYLRFIGKNYHLVFRIYEDNTYQGIYSRPIKRRRYKEDDLEIKAVGNIDFKLNPDLLTQNKLGGSISFIIQEPHSKNTVISGSFSMNIPNHPNQTK